MQSEPIKVLLVDDDLGDIEMIRAMLSQAEHGSFRVDWVSSYEEALDAFEQDRHDVYFVDYFLEDRDGLDLLKEASDRGLSAPLIMLTGRGTGDLDLEALEAGAADFLVKGRIDPDVLERSIRHALQQNRAARALAQSEERHRGMFDHLPVGLYRCGPDGSFLDANPALVRILGYPDEETLRGQYSSDLFVHPDDRERFWTMLERQGLVRGFETVISRPDGAPIRVRNTARLQRDSEGEVLYLEGTLEEIAEEKTAEDLRGSEARFRAIFDATASGVALVSLDGVIREVNPSMARIFSSSRREMAGLSYLGLLEEGDRAAASRELQAFAEGQRDRAEAERRFVGPDGSLLWARTTTTLIRESDDVSDHIVILLEGLR